MIRSRRDFLKTMTASTTLTLTGFQFGQKTDVIVIGGGLSGLYATMLLEAQGYKVLLLEGNDRLGGRLFTLDDVDGKPDVGEVEIRDNYHLIIKIAKQLQVVLEESVAPTTDVLLHVNGKNTLMKDWANEPTNRLADWLKKIQPMYLETTFLQKNTPFQSTADWLKPEFAGLDISYEAFMKSKGLSDEAIRLIDANANNNGAAVTSALHALKAYSMRNMGENKKTFSIKNGSSRLAEAMAKSLKSQIILGKAVTSIINTKSGVKIECADGTKLKASFAVCTLPFSVLKNIVLDSDNEAGMPHPIQLDAIENLPYTAVSQVLLLPKKQFWKEDGLPPAMWTDTIVGKFSASYNLQGEVSYMKCELNGKQAILLDKMPESEAKTFILNELKKIRPATENNLEVLHLNSWQKNTFSRGAYHQYAQGQVNKFVPYLNKPAGNIHFAGEHTSFSNMGMEGAVESAQRVVAEIKMKT